MAFDSITWISLIAATYLIGSLPTAYLAARILSNADIRKLGDGNAGAANVYRNLGPKAGLAVGSIDIGKGALAVLLARVLMEGQAVEMVAGLSAVAGHNWPFYLQFRGGRGAATAIGALMAFVPLAAVPIGILALAVLWLSKKAVVALAFTFVTIPLMTWITGSSLSSISYVIFLPIIVGLCHFASLRRALPEPSRPGQERVVQAPEGQ